MFMLNDQGPSGDANLSNPPPPLEEINEVTSLSSFVYYRLCSFDCVYIHTGVV